MRASAYLAITVIVGSAITMGMFAGAAGSQIASSGCTPSAYVPYVFPQSHTSRSHGSVSCFESLTYDFDLELRTHYDTILDMQTGEVTNSGEDFYGYFKSCVGYSALHTFLYINQAENGASDTSGETDGSC
jgi:hypothetical protein